MPVRKSLFRLSLMMVSICFLNRFSHRWLLAFFWLLFCLNNLPKAERVFCITGIVLLVALSFPLNSEFPDTGRIVRIRDSYQIVSSGLKKVMIYSKDENIRLGDEVRITCQLQEIDSYDNFERSSFGIWARSENIIAQGRIREYETVHRSKGIRRLIYELNNTEGRKWITSFIFGKGIKSDSDKRYFLISSGMHISFFLSAIRRFLQRFFYEERIRKIQTVLVILLGCLSGFSFGHVRILLNLISGFLFEERRQQCGFTVIILCLLKPYGIRSLPFLLANGLKIISCLSLERSRIISFFYFLSCQLYLEGTCDLVQLVLFPVLRSVYGTFYLLALVCSILPWSINMEAVLLAFQRINDSLPVLEISSQLPAWMFFLLMIMILEYGQIRRKRYLLAAVLLLAANTFKSSFLPFYTVTFLDVGQGDSCVITVPFSPSALLIDTGGSAYRDLASEVLIPYLKRNALRRVSVIVSHDDADHCGALESLMKNYRVEEVIREKKREITFGNLTIHDPLYDVLFSNDNDNSLISYISIGRCGFLFLGDVSGEVEEILAQRYPLMDADIIKLAHHGSSGSTSDRLLSTYLPECGIISAGVNNSYGHPAKEVLERLSAYKVSVLNTQDEGAIRFIVFRRFALYHTSNGKTGFIP